MTLLAVAALVALACILPAVGNRTLVRGGSPRQLVAFSLASLASFAVGFVVLLSAVVDMHTLPTRDLPALVDRCVAATGDLFEHPVDHWPQILGATLLILVLGRLGYGLMATVRAWRLLARTLTRDAVVDPSFRDVLILPTAARLGAAVGIFRRRVVISEGAIAALWMSERSAVLRHERKHIQAGHAVLLLLGQTVARAFPFVPPIRDAVQQLHLGLECVADRAALEYVKDPIVVAEALMKMAEPGPVFALKAADFGLRQRVDRLLTPPRSRSFRVAGPIAVAAAIFLFLTLVAVLPVSATSLSARADADAVHDVCHLPHPGVLGDAEGAA
jgi:Zn-dependent protease with chaperone function